MIAVEAQITPQNRLRKCLYHAAFWLGIVLLFGILRIVRNESLDFSFTNMALEIIPLSGMAIAVYVNQGVLIPKLLAQRQFVYYGTALLILLLLNTTLVNFLFQTASLFVDQDMARAHHSGAKFFFGYTTGQLIFISFSSFFHFARENARLNELALSLQEMEKGKLKAELNSLKTQINPHFLFNTLNNIYSYSLLNSEKTPEMILKLSALMNYIIYECDADEVRIHQEIEFMHSYLALEKMRVEEDLELDISIAENLPDFQIAPLMFLPFLENAVKHGANISSQKPRIQIKLKIDEQGVLKFKCQNRIDVGTGSEPSQSPEDVGGFGLQNIRKRLEHTYPYRHHLQITENQSMFLVELSINLGDNNA